MLGDSLQPRRNWPDLNSTWTDLGYNQGQTRATKSVTWRFFALLGWITVAERKENGFCSILCTRLLLHEDGDGDDGFSLVDALSNTRDDLARGKEHDMMWTWAHTFFSSSTGFYNKRRDRRRWQCWFGGVGVRWWWWAKPATACGDEEDWKKVRGSISWLLLLFRLLLCYSFFFFSR